MSVCKPFFLMQSGEDISGPLVLVRKRRPNKKGVGRRLKPRVGSTRWFHEGKIKMISQRPADGWRTAQAALQKYYPGTETLGWRLRERFKHQWVRFYALPGGELPSNLRKEKEQILHRFKEISSCIFGYDAPIVVAVPLRQGISRPSARKADYLESLGFDMGQSESIDDDDEIPASYDIFTATIGSASPELTTLILEIMKACVEQAVVNATDGNVVAPYEGGFDVISPRQDVLGRVSSKFSEWRSDRFDGL